MTLAHLLRINDKQSQGSVVEPNENSMITEPNEAYGGPKYVSGEPTSLDDLT